MNRTADEWVEVVWQGEQRYQGGPAGGPALLLDGEREAGPSPVQALLVALAACSAIDVVEVLQKRRTPPTELRVGVAFSRAAEAPRRLQSAQLSFSVRTTSERAHVERAVRLSFDKYCSVAHSLAPDVQVSWRVELAATG